MFLYKKNECVFLKENAFIFFDMLAHFYLKDNGSAKK